MNQDMFGEIETDVIVSFADGHLSIVVTAQLDKVQKRAFCADVVRAGGLARIEVDTFAPHSDDVTAFYGSFRQNVKAGNVEAIRQNVKVYALAFMDAIKPTAVQNSLF